MNETADPTGSVELHSPHAHRAKPHHMSGLLRRRLVIGLLVVIGLGGVAAGAAMLGGFLPGTVIAGDPKAHGLTDGKSNGAIRVKAIRPRRDPSFRLSSQQIATVEPYMQAGLRARVSGVVRHVTKEIGEPVRAGELLLEIDVPDLEEAVRQKGSLIEQRQRELSVAQSDLTVAKVAVRAAAVATQQKGIDVSRAKDLRTARKLDLDAVRTLFQQSSAVKSRVDSAELDYHAAERAVESAESDVEKAKVEEAGKAASLAKAEADIELKRALVEVARKDRDVAAAQLGYAKLYAPFDGVVTARVADPGRFVANATTGASEPLITVARTDLVTVVMKAPDVAAPFISPTTEVSVEFAQLPGVAVRGTITRYSPVIDQSDRTMRIEVDVCNIPPEEYRANRMRSSVRIAVSPLQPFDRGSGLLASGVALLQSMSEHKGWNEGEALIPEWGLNGRMRPIVPGTTATMRVLLDKFADIPLLPDSAIYGKSGQSYILLVENGVTRAVPVAVQVRDGRLSKVAMVAPNGSREVIRELTGDEVIVAARQVEIGDGVRVDAVVEGW
jgi:multidrug resistance efflux pump